MAQPLMPKATAVWLVDNTALTFDQIAAFCSLHPLEVKGIADGDVAAGIKGRDPIANGELTREELERCEKDPQARLEMRVPDHPLPETRSKGPRYTPLSKRQDRPNAIAWLLRNHPELSDAQVSRLVGTTKPTINAVRDRTHWNMTNIKPADPVSLGLCTQIELDEAVQKAATRLARQEAKGKKSGKTLKPAAETGAPEHARIVPPPYPGETSQEETPAAEPSPREEEEAPITPEDVFGPSKD